MLVKAIDNELNKSEIKIINNNDFITFIYWNAYFVIFCSLNEYLIVDQRGINLACNKLIYHLLDIFNEAIYMLLID